MTVSLTSTVTKPRGPTQPKRTTSPREMHNQSPRLSIPCARTYPLTIAHEITRTLVLQDFGDLNVGWIEKRF